MSSRPLPTLARLHILARAAFRAQGGKGAVTVERSEPGVLYAHLWDEALHTLRIERVGDEVVVTQRVSLWSDGPGEGSKILGAGRDVRTVRGPREQLEALVTEALM